MKKLFFVALLLLWAHLNLSAGSDLIEVQARRYEITIKNTFTYTLKVHLIKKNGKAESRVLSPQEQWVKKGYFSSATLKKTTIVAEYNMRTFQIDKSKADRAISAINRREQEQQVWNFFKGALIEAAKNSRYRLIKFFGYAADYTQKAEQLHARLLSKDYNGLMNDLFRYGGEYVAVEGGGHLLREHGMNKMAARSMISGAIAAMEDTRDHRAYQHVSYFLEGALTILFDKNFERIHTYSVFSVAKSLDLNTRTPGVLLSVEPLSTGADLNTYWKSSPDKLLVDKDKNKEFEWGNGLTNNIFGGSFSVALSPEIKFSSGFYSRLYGGLSYYSTAYELGAENFSLSGNFFKSVPAGGHGFSIEAPLSFQHQRLGFDLNWRFFVGNALFLDLNGGYVRHSGQLNLKNSTLSDGYSWDSEKVKLVNEYFTPNFGAKIGIGHNGFHKGAHLTCGLQLFKMDHQNVSAYQITDLSTDQEVSFGSGDQWIHRINVGLNFAF